VIFDRASGLRHINFADPEIEDIVLLNQPALTAALRPPPRH
jgi:hypothetical protein